MPELERGDVYLVPFELPHHPVGGATDNVRKKFVVVLQGGPRFVAARDRATVICSTRRQDHVQPFEVAVGPDQGFEHDTIIDGRWVYTVGADDITAGRYITRLDPKVMHQVAVAIVAGLQL